MAAIKHRAPSGKGRKLNNENVLVYILTKESFFSCQLSKAKSNRKNTSAECWNSVCINRLKMNSSEATFLNSMYNHPLRLMKLVETETFYQSHLHINSTNHKFSPIHSNYSVLKLRGKLYLTRLMGRLASEIREHIFEITIVIILKKSILNNSVPLYKNNSCLARLTISI